ncbi:MAG: PQQ-binding-like beta-propeller repeat protein, partial [Euryarchaeota archaeon]|nr:PQQ-binding-like beta-propeller repeat protein [Euryarchaeota archaeon]
FLDLQGLADGDQGPAESGGWTGDELHRVAAGAPVTASPVVTDSYVYLDVSGDLWAIDRRFGGAAVWSHATPQATEGTPAIAGDVVVARRSDGRVYAFHRATGQIEWVRGTLRAPVGGEDMAAADGRVFLSARNGTSFDLVTLDAGDGSVLDRNATAGRARLGAPIVAGNLVLVAEGASLLAFRGQPDLAVFAADVVMNLGPASGGVARGNVSTSVRNNGDEPVYGVRVRVYDGDEATGALLGEATVGTAEKPLKPASRTTVYTSDRDWSVGRHTITVIVDRAVTETDIGNNKAVAFVYVQEGPPPPPQVLGAGPYWVALLLGFLVGVAVLYLPIRRVRELRRKELEKP